MCALQTSAHKTLVFSLLSLISRQTKRKKQHEYSGTPSRVFVFFPKQPQVVVLLDEPFFFLVRFPKAFLFVCA